jgi:hypothetical protein
VIPFYSIEKPFSSSLASNQNLTMEVSKEPFSYNPFDLAFQHLPSSSSLYFSQLQTRRIIIKGRFPPIFLTNSIDCFIGSPFVISNDNAEMMELPLCFYYFDYCNVEDIKKKLISLFHAMNNGNIHLFLLISSSSSSSSSSMVRVEIQDKTSLNDLFPMDDMIIEFEFEILLENYLISAYYLDKEQTEENHENQENQNINQDTAAITSSNQSSNINVRNNRFEFPLFDSFSALHNTSSTAFLPILPNNDFELTFLFTEELTMDLLPSLKHMIIHLKNINEDYSIHPIEVKYSIKKSSDLSSSSSSSMNEVTITSSTQLIPSCFYELSFIYYNQKNEERSFTLLFKTKKVIGFMMNRSVVSFKATPATSKKKGRKRKDTSKPAVGGKRKRSTKAALDDDKDEAEELVEEDAERSVMEKVLKPKKTKRVRKSNQLYKGYSTIMSEIDE